MNSTSLPPLQAHHPRADFLVPWKVSLPSNVGQACLNPPSRLFSGKLPQRFALAMVPGASEKQETAWVSWFLCSQHQGRLSRCLAVTMTRLGLPEQGLRPSQGMCQERLQGWGTQRQHCRAPGSVPELQVHMVGCSSHQRESSCHGQGSDRRAG